MNMNLKPNGFPLGACVSFADIAALPENLQELIASYLYDLMDLGGQK